MSEPTQYYRVGHCIYKPDRSLDSKFASIGAAKRWSRSYQERNGGLGAGAVRVINSVNEIPTPQEKKQ